MNINSIVRNVSFGAFEQTSDGWETRKYVVFLDRSDEFPLSARGMVLSDVSAERECFPYFSIHTGLCFAMCLCFGFGFGPVSAPVPVTGLFSKHVHLFYG